MRHGLQVDHAAQVRAVGEQGTNAAVIKPLRPARSATLIDGIALAEKTEADVRRRVEELRAGYRCISRR